MAEKVSFAEGQARLGRILQQLLQQVHDQEQAADRAEIECERCGYFPCVCGEEEFEAYYRQQLQAAADAEVL